MGLTFDFVYNGEVLATSNELEQASNSSMAGSIIIAHELEHMRQRLFKLPDMYVSCTDKKPDLESITFFSEIIYAEVLAIEVENLVRKDFNEKLRTHYKNVVVCDENGIHYKKLSGKFKATFDTKANQWRNMTSKEIKEENKIGSEDLGGRPNKEVRILEFGSTNVNLVASSSINLNYASSKMKYAATKRFGKVLKTLVSENTNIKIIKRN